MITTIKATYYDNKGVEQSKEFFTKNEAIMWLISSIKKGEIIEFENEILLYNRKLEKVYGYINLMNNKGTKTKIVRKCAACCKEFGNDISICDECKTPTINTTNTFEIFDIKSKMDDVDIGYDKVLKVIDDEVKVVDKVI